MYWVLSLSHLILSIVIPILQSKNKGSEIGWLAQGHMVSNW